MQCDLCDFLIIKPQTALHHAVRCDAVMSFCGRFWCGLCSLCGLMNTPTCNQKKKKKPKVAK